MRKPECIFLYQFRYISTIFTSFLIKTKITPNQITIISFLFGILAAISFLLGQYKYMIFGAIFFFLSYILDLVDGEIARYKNISSTFGHWLDKVSDSTTLFLVCVGISIGFFTQTKNPSTLILGLFSLLILALIGIISVLYGSNKIIRKSKSLKISDSFYIGMYTPTVLLFIIGTLTKQINLMFVIYLIIGSIALTRLFISKYKLLKNMEDN